MADDKIILAPTDIVGIIQRGLRELSVYCDRPAEDVDPGTLIAYMGRLAHFAEQLPRPAAQAPQAQDAPEARAN